MGFEIKECPKCGKKSFIYTPAGRIMRESWGVMVHVADEYYWMCLEKKCGYKTERIRINTKAGDRFDLPWYKRIFKF